MVKIIHNGVQLVVYTYIYTHTHTISVTFLNNVDVFNLNSWARQMLYELLKNIVDSNMLHCLCKFLFLNGMAFLDVPEIHKCVTILHEVLSTAKRNRQKQKAVSFIWTQHCSESKRDYAISIFITFSVVLWEGISFKKRWILQFDNINIGYSMTNNKTYLIL